jgi:hypothetical protein
MYGWYLIGSISFVFIFNFYFVFREIGKLFKRYIRKYFNLFQFHFNKKKENSSKPDEQSIKDIIRQREAF